MVVRVGAPSDLLPVSKITRTGGRLMTVVSTATACSKSPTIAPSRYGFCVGYLETPWHIVLLLVIALLLFGGKKLPEIGRSLGSAMREFKDAIAGNEPVDSRPELSSAEPTVAQTTGALPAQRETV